MRKVNFALLAAFFLWAVLPNAAQARDPFDSPQPYISPERFLNPDGTLNLPSDFSGNIDLAGWDVRLDSFKGPIFSPLALSAGEWAALGGTGSGDGSLSSTVFALAVMGGDLYVGGIFTDVNNNGTTLTAADRIAKWDGANWSALGSNGAGGGSLANNQVNALAVIGTDLYVGGTFINVNNNGTSLTAADRIAKWDGTDWTALSSNGAAEGSLLTGAVNALAVIGADLYVGGTFTDVNNNGTSLTAADRIAKWDGTDWSALSSNGAGGGSLSSSVFAMAVIGSDLYVGGLFTNVNNGGTSLAAADRIAKWDGTNWSALGSGTGTNGSLTSGQVNALAVIGTDLFVGGTFLNVVNSGTTLTAADRIAKWDGANWTALGSNGAADGSLNNSVLALSVIGTDLYVGGPFTDVNNSGTSLTAADRIVKWDGTDWSALGTGTTGDGSIDNGQVSALFELSGELYVGGTFTNVINNGSPLTAADRIAKWDGSDWSALSGNGAATGSLNAAVTSVAVIGTDLYVGGLFTNVNNNGTTLTAADRIAKWDGTSWSALGSNGAGNGSIINGQVNALAVIGTDLYVGGTFTNVSNSGTSLTAADRIAKWDGTNWSALSSDGATNGSLNNTVNALAVIGTDLYIGGTFTNVNNNGTSLTAADRIAMWDGADWSALSSNGVADGSLGNTVSALAVISSDLYVGGTFTNVNNNGTSLTAADRIAKWDGADWSALGSNGAAGGSINSTVSALAVIGSDLYVGGAFTNVNNNGTSLTSADRIAMWDGTNWSALGNNGASDGSLNNSVLALFSQAGELFVGGSFTDVNNYGTVLPEADYIVRWGGSNWCAIGSDGAGNGSLNNNVRVIGFYSDLLAGGDFTNANNGGTVIDEADRIAAFGAPSGCTPTYTAVPPDGSTLAITGLPGSNPSLDIDVTNTGDANSQLSVQLTSISAGYSVAGLPISGLETTDPASTITVECDSVPAADGTLILATNDPANASVTYDLTCTSLDPTYSAIPPDGSTLDFDGPVGSNPRLDIVVSNAGDPGSKLDVSLASISSGYIVVSGLPINDLETTDPASTITVQCNSFPQPDGTLALTTNDPANPNVGYQFTCAVDQEVSQCSIEISFSGTTILPCGRFWGSVPASAIPNGETNCKIDVKEAGRSTQYGFSLDDTVSDLKIICDSGPITIFFAPITVCIQPKDHIVTNKSVFHNHGGGFTAIAGGSGPSGYVCGSTQVLSLFTLGEFALPGTGFAPGRLTRLSEQPASSAYFGYDALMLEIPQLDLLMPIWGVPQGLNGWDVSWLGENAGYLYGTAFPTWVGNSVLTAHVWSADNRAGLFYHLRNLQYGDQFYIHSGGQTFTYEVRANRLVSEKDLSVIKDSDYSLITLITCETFNESSGEYSYRRSVQAVLVSVE